MGAFKKRLSGLFLRGPLSIVGNDRMPSNLFGDSPALQALEIRPIHVFLGNKVPFAFAAPF